MYVGRIYFVGPGDVFCKDGTCFVTRIPWWRIVKRPIVALTDKAYGCRARNVDLLRLNPSSELLAKHHPQEAE
jgi:hypothetical protein